MSAQRRPTFSCEDATMTPDAAESVSSVLLVVRGTRAAADADEGLALRATELFSVPGHEADPEADPSERLRAADLFDVPGVTPPSADQWNAGSTELMPSAFMAQVNDAVRASNGPRVTARPVAPASTGLRPPEQPPMQPFVHAPVHPPPRAASPVAMGLTRFEIVFAASTAVVVGLSAAVLFVYLG